MSELKNDIEQLITNVLAGEASKEDKAVLDEWRGRSASNQLLFDEYTRLFKESDELLKNQDVASIDVVNEWQIFQSRIDEGKVVSLNTSDGKSTGFSWMKIAASILLLMTAGFFIYRIVIDSDVVTLQAAEVKEEFTLPDASVITLNAHSQISYEEGFGTAHRNLKLEGEAFFDVEKNKHLPFVIATPNAEVSVLGTSFNVDSDDHTTEVVVATGLVALKGSSSNEEVRLKPGEKGVLNEVGELSSEQNDDPNFNAWNSGIIIFENADLVAVVNAINKVYQSNISISPTISQSCMVTVTFEQQSLEAVLNVLESTLELVLERTGNNVEIIEAGC